MLIVKNCRAYTRIITPIINGGFRITYYSKHNKIIADSFVNEQDKLRSTREGERFFDINPLLSL